VQTSSHTSAASGLVTNAWSLAMLAILVCL
jgi:hypothetical protein